MTHISMDGEYTLEYRKHVDYFFRMAVIGAVGLAISYMSEMSKNIQTMAISFQVLSERILVMDKTTQDHELRIRTLETLSNKK